MCSAVILAGTVGWCLRHALYGVPATGCVPGRQQNRGWFTWQVWWYQNATAAAGIENSVRHEPKPDQNPDQ
jgi:hypothetical protein